MKIKDLAFVSLLEIDNKLFTIAPELLRIKSNIGGKLFLSLQEARQHQDKIFPKEFRLGIIAVDTSSFYEKMKKEILDNYVYKEKDNLLGRVYPDEEEDKERR